MAKGEPFKLESNLKKITEKIQEKPNKVMNIIGQQLVREIKANELKTNYSRRTKILEKTLGYWARKKERDLQIGFKMSIEKNAAGVGPGIVGGIMTGQESDPLKSAVIRNKDLIVKLIGEALDQIRME